MVIRRRQGPVSMGRRWYLADGGHYDAVHGMEYGAPEICQSRRPMVSCWGVRPSSADRISFADGHPTGSSASLRPSNVGAARRIPGDGSVDWELQEGVDPTTHT